MTRPDAWAAAFAEPSKLWQPASSWKPHEWTPLFVALGRIEDSLAGDLEMAEIDLHQAFVGGRMKSALRYLSSDDGSKQIWHLLLQPKFWQHLKITLMSRTELFVEVEGDVEGRPLWIGRGFFVCTADLDKHLLGEPVARPPDVAQSEGQPPRKRKAPQADRIKPAIIKCFPNGTDGIPTKVIYRAVANELKADKKQGLEDPSETSVKRALGRRK